jgi:hypothetical protein
MLLNMDGDAKRIHRGLSWFGQRRPYVQRGGRVLYFLAPKCLRRGYKLREREPVPGLKKKVKGCIARDVDLRSGGKTYVFAVCRCPLASSRESPAFPFIG